MTDDPAVVVAEHGSVLVATLNRPRVRNAINEELSVGLAAALERLDKRDDLRVAVLVGAGGTFCAGMDLREFSGRPPEEPAAALDRIVRHGARKPVIAAIEGYAVGGGLELALACDLIVAARDAQLGIPEVRRSLVPSGGALLRLPARVPFAVAMEMALTGVTLTGERLHATGLVSRVSPSGGALAAARTLADEIAACGPLAVNGSKALLWDQATGQAGDGWDRQAVVCDAVNTSADAQEGVTAFLEKRAPRFGGT
jgi:enoyl-CoA hydratase